MLFHLISLFLFCFSLNVLAKDTQVHLYRPFGGLQGQPQIQIKHTVEGECKEHSNRTPRSDAWRCTTAEWIIDPCFIRSYGNQKEALCPDAPWLDAGMLIHIQTGHNESRNEEFDLSKSYPWAVKLENGLACIASDKPTYFQHLVVRYQCADNTFLFGHLQRCKAQWSILHQQKTNAVETVTIAEAWF